MTEFFVFLHDLSVMRKTAFWILAVACLLVAGCSGPSKDAYVIDHSFHNAVWERFDYIHNDIELKEPATFDLDLRVGFTDDYPYDDFEIVFTVFDGQGNRYRAKGYKFVLKDGEGHWKSPLKDGCHTYEFPINKELKIADAGTYRFQVEYRMPKTPLVGVKELTLINNN